MRNDESTQDYLYVTYQYFNTIEQASDSINTNRKWLINEDKSIWDSRNQFTANRESFVFFLWTTRYLKNHIIEDFLQMQKILVMKVLLYFFKYLWLYNIIFYIIMIYFVITLRVFVVLSQFSFYFHIRRMSKMKLMYKCINRISLC